MSKRVYRPAIDDTMMDLLAVGQRAAIAVVDAQIRSGVRPRTELELLEARHAHQELLDRITAWRSRPKRA